MTTFNQENREKTIPTGTKSTRPRNSGAHWLEPSADSIWTPAASESTQIAETNLTKSDDGLSHEWYGDVWLNPPFSEKARWYRKARSQHNAGNTDRIFALFPVDVSTEWFHKNIAESDCLCLLPGRDWYQGESNPNFSTGIALFGDLTSEIQEAFASLGVPIRVLSDDSQLTLAEVCDD